MSDMTMMAEKWGIVFKLMDINKDGVVSSQDKDFCKTVFSGLSTSDDNTGLLKDLDFYWDKMTFPGESPDWDQQVSEEQFIQRYSKLFSSDKAATVKMINEAVKCLLTAADIDGSKVFTFGKFFNFHEAFNLAHEIIVRTTFNLIGPGPEDTCTFDQMHGFYVELFIGEDQAKFEALKTAYKALGMM